MSDFSTRTFLGNMKLSFKCLTMIELKDKHFVWSICHRYMFGILSIPSYKPIFGSEHSLPHFTQTLKRFRTLTCETAGQTESVFTPRYPHWHLDASNRETTPNELSFSILENV